MSFCFSHRKNYIGYAVALLASVLPALAYSQQITQTVQITDQPSAKTIEGAGSSIVIAYQKFDDIAARCRNNDPQATAQLSVDN